jgi:hypothetical protein
MPKLSWSAFIDRYLAAHLVAGIMPEGDPITGNAPWARGAGVGRGCRRAERVSR